MRAEQKGNELRKGEWGGGGRRREEGEEEGESGDGKEEEEEEEADEGYSGASCPRGGRGGVAYHSNAESAGRDERRERPEDG
eukprot:763538-Hanusia_phi.AAC.2